MSIVSGIGKPSPPEFSSSIEPFPDSCYNIPITKDSEGYFIALNGNIISDEAGMLFHYTHALFTFVENGTHGAAGGYIKSITVLYTAEIELRPVSGGIIRRIPDEKRARGFGDSQITRVDNSASFSRILTKNRKRIICRPANDHLLFRIGYNEVIKEKEDEIMIGAILGDMIDAPYEFDRSPKTKDFPFFSRGTEFKTIPS